MPPGRYNATASAPADAPLLEAVQEYAPRLRAFARRHAPDPATADDVVQEALRRSLEALRDGRIRTPDALPAFLFQTARHVCLHWLRRSYREMRALRTFQRDNASTWTADPADRLSCAEEARAVRAALARLAQADRDLLLWSYRDGLDAATIGARMQLAAPTVRVRRHRAMQRLRASLMAPPADSQEVR